MQFRPVLVPIATAMLLAGCGSSTAASKSNFAKAINEAFAKDCIAYDSRADTGLAAVYSSQYPATVARVFPQAFDAFDVMVKMGLLTSTNPKNALVPNKTYALTAAGEKALKSRDGIAFCAGHWQVKEVTKFTKPGKSQTGATTSSVQFTPVAGDLASWVAGYPGLKTAISAVRNGSADLVLANNGWEAQVATIGN